MIYQAYFSTQPCRREADHTFRRSLTVDQRTSYINAIKCMLTSPPKYKNYFSVVNSRYDDFVALHANATGGGIHLNGFSGRTAFNNEQEAVQLDHLMEKGIHMTGTFLPCKFSASFAALEFEILILFCGYRASKCHAAVGRHPNQGVRLSRHTTL
jgi:hypothetical protein